VYKLAGPDVRSTNQFREVPESHLIFFLILNIKYEYLCCMGAWPSGIGAYILWWMTDLSLQGQGWCFKAM